MTRVRRVVALAATMQLTALPVVIGVAPAQAHGISIDPSRFRSAVVAVVPPVPGLSVSMAGGGAYVTLTNRTGSTLTILGPQGQEYVRVTTRGVEQNVALVPLLVGQLVVNLPPGPSAQGAPPQWVLTSPEPSFTWRDSRTQWVGSPRASTIGSLRHSHKVRDWTVPLRVGDEPVTVQGSLVWIGLPLTEGDKAALVVLLVSVILATGGLLALGMIAIARWVRSEQLPEPEPAHVAPTHRLHRRPRQVQIHRRDWGQDG